MDKEEALREAKNLLAIALQHQANLISYASPASDTIHGKRAAEFCIGFIDTYSGWLEKKNK